MRNQQMGNIGHIKQEETSRRKHWVTLIGKFLSVQILVQLLSGITSIILVRTLSKDEYGYYTIANSMQGTITLLADMGLSAGMMYIGGRVWEDRVRFGQMLSTAFRIRWYMAFSAAAFVIPILIYLLHKNGAGIYYIATILILFCGLLFFQLQVNILTIVPRIYAQIDKLQKLDLISAISRFLLIAVAALVFMNTPVTIAITIIAFGLQYYFLNKWVYATIHKTTSIHPDDHNELLILIKSQAASGIFFCIQGQVSTWLISIFGNVEQIADVGALGRMEMIYMVIHTTMNAIFIPMFAKAQEKKQVRKIYLRIISLYIVIGIGIIGFSILFPEAILWVLGPKYAHLQQELVYMMCSLALGSMVAILWTMNISRAWVQYSWAYIPSTIITQIVLLYFLQLDNVRDVILFGILSRIPNVLLNIILSYRGFRAFDIKPA
jgi:O-antigen/teichoic acid export membrane protein